MESAVRSGRAAARVVASAGHRAGRQMETVHG
jgi:hypothetical protein